MASTEDMKASGLFDVSHVTALVTGGATGIGLSKWERTTLSAVAGSSLIRRMALAYSVI